VPLRANLTTIIRSFVHQFGVSLGDARETDGQPVGLYPGHLVDPASVIRKPYEICVTTWEVRDLELNSHLVDPVCARDIPKGTWVVDARAETGYTTLSQVSVQSLVGAEATPRLAATNTWNGRLVMASLAICLALVAVIFIRRFRSGTI
jgi:hypothetical protein